MTMSHLNGLGDASAGKIVFEDQEWDPQSGEYVHKVKVKFVNPKRL